MSEAFGGVSNGASAGRGALRIAFDWLRAPLAADPDVSHRRVRLLAWMLLWLLVLLGAAIAIVVLVDPSASPRRLDYLELVIVLGVFFTGAYLVNAAGHYTLAAWMTLLPAMAQPWISLYFDHEIIATGDYMPMLYASVSILLSAFLLSPWVTLGVAAVEFVGLLMIPVLVPASRSFNWASALTFIVITSALGILCSGIMRRDLDEIDRQAHALAETGAMMREASIRDFLTGLYNRRHLHERLAQEIARAERAEDTIGVIVFDADNLKQINDEKGHAAGDAVLKYVGAVARANTRGSDLACRSGGDEFVLVMPGTSRESTIDRAMELHEMMRSLDFDGECPDCRVTVSVGTAVYPQNGGTADELLAAADEALYRAKRAGRDQVASAG